MLKNTLIGVLTLLSIGTCAATDLEVLLIRHASQAIDAPRVTVLDGVVLNYTDAEPVTHTVKRESMLSYIANPAILGQAWILLPSTMHAAALEAGWIRTHFQPTPLVASLFGLPNQLADREVGTPGKLTGVHAVMVPLLRDDQVVTEFDSHFTCVRAVYAGGADRCITAQGLIDIYATRFGLPPLTDHGPRKSLPGLGFFASPGIDPALLAQLKRADFQLLRSGRFEGL